MGPWQLLVSLALAGIMCHELSFTLYALCEGLGIQKPWEPLNGRLQARHLRVQAVRVAIAGGSRRIVPRRSSRAAERNTHCLRSGRV